MFETIPNTLLLKEKLSINFDADENKKPNVNGMSRSVFFCVHRSNKVMFKDFPKISCLMVTANGRLEHFKRSYQCYLDQTYPNKELVIVNEGTKEYQRDIKDVVQDKPDIKMVFLDGSYTLGSLRNISMSLCSGEIWVQWDDDDFNISQRLMIQYQSLVNSKKSICYFTDQLHYYFPTKELYWENWKTPKGQLRYCLIPGTCMSWKSFKLKYPSSGEFSGAGEDSVMAVSICKNDQSDLHLLSGKGYSQVYSYHGKNVWDLEHHKEISKKKSYPISFMIDNKDKIVRTLDELNFGTSISVMGNEGLAFIH